jgi:AcrR family transcriptional regulator
MGSRERRQRHRARVRQAILVAARELFVAEGVRNVSLRQIADRIEYSPAVFYTYFRCKDDIFLALAEEDAAVLHRVCEATRHVVDPLERIRRTLWALYEFLNANPVFVELIILGDAGPRMKAGHQRFACFHEVAAGVDADLRACIERGQMSMALSATAVRQLLWVGMLGAATVARRLARDEECDVLAHDLLETLLAGLSTAPCQRRESDLESALTKPAHDDHTRCVSTNPTTPGPA